jgi:hypothetical protein
MILERRDVPGNIILMLRSLFAFCWCKVLINGKVGQSIRLNTGLFQGSLLSPLLFTLFIDELANKLSTPQPQSYPKQLLFADDIKLQYTATSNVDEMQKDLNSISNWCHENNMIVGMNKSAVIWCGNSNSNHQPPLYLSQQILPTAKEYKYLGVEHDMNGINWEVFVQRCVTKAVRLLTSLSEYASTWKEAIKVIIFKVFLRSRLEYCCPLVFANAVKNNNDISKILTIELMQDVYNKAMMWIFNSAIIRKTEYSLAGILPLIDRLEMLSLSFVIHVQRAPSTCPGKQSWNELTSFPAVLTRSIITVLHFLPIVQRYRGTVRGLRKHKGQEKSQQVQRFIRNETTIKLCECMGKLAAYVTKSSRTPGLMDKTLGVMERREREFALRWRRNLLYHTHYCSHCGDPWTRKHLVCSINDEHLAIMQEVEYRSCVQAVPAESRNGFTVFDYMVNRGKIQQVMSHFDKLRAGML